MKEIKNTCLYKKNLNLMLSSFENHCVGKGI